MNYPTPYGNSESLALENLRLTKLVRELKKTRQELEDEVESLRKQVAGNRQERRIMKNMSDIRETFHLLASTVFSDELEVQRLMEDFDEIVGTENRDIIRDPDVASTYFIVSQNSDNLWSWGFYYECALEWSSGNRYRSRSDALLNAAVEAINRRMYDLAEKLRDAA